MTAPQPGGTASRLAVPVLVIGLLVGVVVVLAWPMPGSGRGDGGGTRPVAPAVATPAADARLEAAGAVVLREWDGRRAAAWAAGDARALASLYVPGAPVGAADVAMLRDWTTRGLAVDALTTQLLAVAVLRHAPGRWVLRVRDRVTGAVATGAGLAEALPAGAAAVREIELRRVAGAWRVASVRPAPSRR